MVYDQHTNFSTSPLLSGDEIRSVEARHPDGLTSAEIVDVFCSKGMRFSEATLRKYVQQGLLPRSQRVGQKGKHKGSRGIYPVSTLRLINDIKRLMTLDYTIEDIQNNYAFVDGEIEELRQLLNSIISKLERSTASAESDGFLRAAIGRQLDDSKQAADVLMTHLDMTVQKIRESAHLSRNAV